MKAGALALFAICFAFAASAATPDVMSAVPGHPGVRYFDLMKLVVPDLAPDADSSAVGHRVVPLAAVGDRKKVETPPDIELRFVETVEISDDPTRLVVLADLGEVEFETATVNALALFRLTPTPKLLDVVDVGTDRNTGFSETPTGLLAPKSPLILVASGHGNSNQAYLSTQMIYIRDNRFEEIDSVFTLSDDGCAFDRKQAASFRLSPSPGPYRALDVEVLETVTPTDAECGDEKAPPASETAYRASYGWDAKRRKFVTSSKELDRLFKLDEKRF
jgi:hypothetical protein